MKMPWGAFKDARNFGWIILAVLAAVTYFSGRYDEIRLLEFWSLILVSAAASIYVMRHWTDDKATAALIVLFLTSGLFGWLIVHRQNLRYEAYDASYDIAHNDTLSDEGRDAVQVGLCILNPNEFPLFARITSLTANIGGKSGSYATENEPFVVPRYSNIMQAFSDPIELPPLSFDPLTGLISATVEYGRNEKKLKKELKIDVDIAYIRDLRSGDVVGIQGHVLRGASPNSYALAPRTVSSCRVLGQG